MSGCSSGKGAGLQGNRVLTWAQPGQAALLGITSCFAQVYGDTLRLAQCQQLPGRPHAIHGSHVKCSRLLSWLMLSVKPGTVRREGHECCPAVQMRSSRRRCMGIAASHTLQQTGSQRRMMTTQASLVPGRKAWEGVVDVVARQDLRDLAEQVVALWPNPPQVDPFRTAKHQPVTCKVLVTHS